MIPPVTEGKVPSGEMTSPPVVIMPDNEKTSTWRQKKYVVIAISVVVVAAIVVGGFIGGMYLMHKSSSNMVEVMNFRFKDKDGKNMQETIKTDTKKRQTEIDVKKDGQDFKLINDFNRGISVFRASDDGQPVCYASPLNVSEVMGPDALESYKGQHPDEESIAKTTPIETRYKAADSPITDTSFLAPSVQEMCKGLNVYWIYPTTEKDGAGRQKRGLRCGWRYLCRASCCWRKCCIVVFRCRWYYTPIIGPRF